MASNVQVKKELKDLNEKEAQILLENVKCKTIRNKLLSGEYGEMTGEVLEELDDETLQHIGVSIPFQRKQFLRSLGKYKAEGILLDLLGSDETFEKPNLETNQIMINDLQTVSLMDNRKKLHKRLCENEILEASSSEMTIYAFPANKVRVKDLQQSLHGTNLKKIIIIGETGTGKSTFIDAFINYAVGVKMEDTFRFKLVVDEEDRADDQIVSQTSEISGYFINDTLLDFPIQIWDTPGFGDTRGVERDEVIKEQINELLKLENFCHVVCFVVRAGIHQLTATQIYIIDRVLLLFGKEAQANIYLLATFADDSRPAVLRALEKCNTFPFDENHWFIFNNGSLFKPNSKRTCFSKEYWSIVDINMTKLFNMIGEIHPFSLTSRVLSEREDLDRQLNEIDFIDLSRMRFLTLTTSTMNTICKKCISNCHIDCNEKLFCKKFNWKHKCKICSCSFNNHHQVRYIYEVEEETRF